MGIFLTSPLTALDLGAIGIMFMIIAALIKLLAFMVKKKFDDEELSSCKVFEKGVCPIHDEWKKMLELLQKIYDTHLGNQAIGKNGVPRWFIREDMYEKIEEMYIMFSRFKRNMETHLEHSHGRSGKLTKESMALYQKICSFITETQSIPKLENKDEQKQ